METGTTGPTRGGSTVFCHLLSLPAAGLLIAGFLMPFALVSCGEGQFESKMRTATGLGIATGNWEKVEDSGTKVSPEAEKSIREKSRGPVELFAVPASGAILALLGLGVLLKVVPGHKAAPVLALGLLTAAVLGFEAYDGFGLRIKEGMLAAIPPEVSEAERRQTADFLEAVEVTPQLGYWLSLGGALLALIGGGVGVGLPPGRTTLRRRGLVGVGAVLLGLACVVVPAALHKWWEKNDDRGSFRVGVVSVEACRFGECEKEILVEEFTSPDEEMWAYTGVGVGGACVPILLFTLVAALKALLGKRLGRILRFGLLVWFVLVLGGGVAFFLQAPEWVSRFEMGPGFPSLVAGCVIGVIGTFVMRAPRDAEAPAA